MTESLLSEQVARGAHARAVVPVRDRGAAVRTGLNIVEVRRVGRSCRELGIQQVVFEVAEIVIADGSQEDRSQLVACPVDDTRQRRGRNAGASNNSPAPCAV